MCKLCDQGVPQNHFGSRRHFLKGVAATGISAAGLTLFAPRPAAADEPPMDSGKLGRRYIIRGGSVMSLEAKDRFDERCQHLARSVAAGTVFPLSCCGTGLAGCRLP